VHNPLGGFQFNHFVETLLFGYSHLEVALRQFAFMASPEKALLDLIHLTPGSDSQDYLKELRLQNLAAINVQTLDALAQRSGKAKLIRAAKLVRKLFISEEGELL
jgi:hypothetical protein